VSPVTRLVDCVVEEDIQEGRVDVKETDVQDERGYKASTGGEDGGGGGGGGVQNEGGKV
jgi:hypothetical protein